MSDTDASGASAGKEPRRVRAADRDLSLDDLVYLNRMTTVGHVLPTVAHEMNNALQVVGGLVEMLGARRDLPPDVAEKVGRIGSQAARATTMLRDLVAFARRDEAGVRTVDLAKVVERALALRRYHLSRARIAVTVEEGADARAYVTRADGHALVQVLVNLLINAEHGLAGRTDGQVRISFAEREDGLAVVVDDNGPGIPAPLQERVTEPFFTTKQPAAGLGLTVAATLVEANGGRLRLEHLAGGGTRVAMTLPAPRPTG